MQEVVILFFLLMHSVKFWESIFIWIWVNGSEECFICMSILSFEKKPGKNSCGLTATIDRIILRYQCIFPIKTDETFLNDFWLAISAAFP